MRIARSASANDEFEINVISLIDVMLTLLMFFVMTATFEHRSLMKVALPEAGSKETTAAQKALEILVDREGRFFIGANEGYPMPGPDGKDISCCSPEWAAVYANRVRQVIDTYRQDGKAKVYWLTVPLPRDPARQRIASVVNQSVAVAAQPWRSQVRIIDTDEYFAPDSRYSDSIKIDGNDQIVRESDGIHLNDAGSSVLADRLLDRIDLDFTR